MITNTKLIKLLDDITYNFDLLKIYSESSQNKHEIIGFLDSIKYRISEIEKECNTEEKFNPFCHSPEERLGGLFFRYPLLKDELRHMQEAMQDISEDIKNIVNSIEKDQEHAIALSAQPSNQLKKDSPKEPEQS